MTTMIPFCYIVALLACILSCCVAKKTEGQHTIKLQYDATEHQHIIKQVIGAFAAVASIEFVDVPCNESCNMIRVLHIAPYIPDLLGSCTF